MNALVETLQKRIADLEDENAELRRDNIRYENAHLTIMRLWERWVEEKYGFRPNSAS